ncbi:hypothetical protein [Lysinibacillus tabacifolii]|uniref:Uncharacterized protein n=1 Tax=Lysinibacillus tabacifolii TaxID=1173107 RepID=A0ABY2SWE1_9BACI|nr:hypothetical protein [Lysinibacillus tabacifolii]TKI47376.1 hypothetical protein FC748_06820 [Lysinibacillus tabacifolii]
MTHSYKTQSVAVIGPARTGKSSLISMFSANEREIRRSISGEGLDKTKSLMRLVVHREMIAEESKVHLTINNDFKNLEDTNPELHSRIVEAEEVIKSSASLHEKIKHLVAVEGLKWSLITEMSDWAKEVISEDVSTLVIYDTEGVGLDNNPYIPIVDNYLLIVSSKNRSELSNCLKTLEDYLISSKVTYLFATVNSEYEDNEEFLDYKREQVDTIMNEIQSKVINELIPYEAMEQLDAYRLSSNYIVYPKFKDTIRENGKIVKGVASAVEASKGEFKLERFTKDLKIKLSNPDNLNKKLEELKSLSDEERNNVIESIKVVLFGGLKYDTDKPINNEPLALEKIEYLLITDGDEDIPYVQVAKCITKGRTKTYDYTLLPYTIPEYLKNDAKDVANVLKHQLENMYKNNHNFEAGMLVLIVRDLMAHDQNFDPVQHGHHWDEFPRNLQSIYSRLYTPLLVSEDDNHNYVEKLQMYGIESGSWNYTTSGEYISRIRETVLLANNLYQTEFFGANNIEELIRNYAISAYRIAIAIQVFSSQGLSLFEEQKV